MSAPFTLTQGIWGADPGDAINWRTDVFRLWLGQPTNMVQLPQIQSRDRIPR